MVSRRNLKLTNSSKQAERSAELYAPRAAAKLRPMLEAVVAPGETVPDVELLMRLLGRVLKVGGERLWSAEHSLGGSRLESLQWRERRDRLKADLRQCLLDVRKGAEGSFAGSETMLGLFGRILRTPIPLLRQARGVIARLEAAPAQGWGERVKPGMVFEFDVHAARLRAVADRFEAACGGLVDTTQRSVLDLAARDRVYLSHHADLVKITRALRGLLEIGDLRKEARDVRPRRRRKGEGEEEGDAAETPAEAAPQAEPDAPEGKA